MENAVIFIWSEQLFSLLFCFRRHVQQPMVNQMKWNMMRKSIHLTIEMMMILEKMEVVEMVEVMKKEVKTKSHLMMNQMKGRRRSSCSQSRSLCRSSRRPSCLQKLHLGQMVVLLLVLLLLLIILLVFLSLVIMVLPVITTSRRWLRGFGFRKPPLLWEHLVTIGMSLIPSCVLNFALEKLCCLHLKSPLL